MKILSKLNAKPTEAELEILNILWHKKEATVRDVYEEICKIKDCGYTTTLKIMQIMFEKQLVTRDNSQKTHIYKPKVSQDGTQKQILDKLLNTLFSGSKSQLVMQALGSGHTSEEELDEIQELIMSLKNTK